MPEIPPLNRSNSPSRTSNAGTGDGRTTAGNAGSGASSVLTENTAKQQFSLLPQRRKRSGSGSSMNQQPASRRRVASPSSPGDQSASTAMPNAPTTASHPSAMLSISAELRQEILLMAATSQPRASNDLTGAARASWAFYAETKPFLEVPVAKAVGKARSLENVRDAHPMIAGLHPVLRPPHAANLLARWPHLSAQEQVDAVPILMNTLDLVIETGKFHVRAANMSADPFYVAAESLRQLKTVKAIDSGFDQIVSRISRLPLAEVSTWTPWREVTLCAVIPKLSVGRRLSAFNQMLDEVADRFAGDENRSGFLYKLSPALASLRKADQKDAALRLFQKAQAGGSDDDEIYAMLSTCPLRRLDPACRLAVFEEMIRLGSTLPANSRNWLADQHEQEWVAALDPQHQAQARAQIANLRSASLA